jgi:hypothetical protein
MAPCSYVGLALGMVLGGRILFGSLDFTDIDGQHPLTVFSLAKLYALGI